jgi:hypothetical protein
VQLAAGKSFTETALTMLGRMGSVVCNAAFDVAIGVGDAPALVAEPFGVPEQALANTKQGMPRVHANF